MENTIAFTLLSLMVATVVGAQPSVSADIKETIAAFAKAGDDRDAATMEKYLDENFRIVMNRLFGSAAVTILSRSVYLEKIKNKEFGGDKRKVTVEEIVLNGTSACAKVTFAGTKMTFVSLITLVKSESGQWKLVSDVPVVKS
jgi:hypothetical protein